MARREPGQESQEARLDRLRAEIAAEEAKERHKRIKPSYPGPTDPNGGIWHKYPPAMWLLPLIAPLVAILAPADALDRWPALAQFCSTMTAWFPFLAGHAKFSSIPQVVTLVKCLSFALLLPLTLLVFLTFWPRRHAYGAARIRAGRILPGRLEELTLAVIAVIGIFGNWVVASDPSWCRRCTTDYRLGLAAADWVGLFGIPFMLVGVVMTLYVRLDVAFGELRGEKKDE